MNRKRRSRAMVVALSGLTAFAAACTVRSSSPPEGIVWIAISDINAFYDDPDDPTNRPPLTRVPPPGMITVVDVSHDGRPDWLIDYEHDGVGRFCGTGGCRRRLYVSTGDHYTRVFDAPALAFSIMQGRGQVLIEAQVHHADCVADDWNCRYAWTWDEAARRLVPAPTADGRAPPEEPLFHPVKAP